MNRKSIVLIAAGTLSVLAVSSGIISSREEASADQGNSRYLDAAKHAQQVFLNTPGQPDIGQGPQHKAARNAAGNENERERQRPPTPPFGR